LSTEDEPAADHSGIGAELSAPEGMTHDRERPAHIVGAEVTAHDRRHAEQAEEAGSDVECTRQLSCAEPSDGQVREIGSFDARERSRAVAPRFEGCIADRPEWTGRIVERRLADEDE
jgi:hypothetical protein